mgnify:CR=1 FL=1
MTGVQTCALPILVIASGGLSMPGLGASPFGYKIAEQFGLKVLPTRAGLVPFTLHKPLLEQLQTLSGVSVPAVITAEDGTVFRENLLFTHRGLSGPAVLQISSYWQPGQPLEVDLLPEVDVPSWLAQAKAHSVAQSLDQGWIIGSDQVCVIDDQILGKPGTHERAVEQLQRLSGHAITFYTGLCLWDVASQQRQVIMEPFVVHFRELNDTQINSYLYQERPYDCAGSFKSEALGICLFERFEGRDPNALVGLPLMALTDMFQTWGITLPLECQ